MKTYQKIFLSTCLFLSSISYSQTSTEKWNSLSRRYEYFDQRGYMTGYKEYNSLGGTWDYYSTNEKPRLNQYNPVVNPVNIELIGQVLASKQARYNAGGHSNGNSYNSKRRYVNEMIHSNDRALNNKDIKKYEEITNISSSIGKDFDKKRVKGELKTFAITELENGWYEQVLFLDGIYAKKFIEINDHQILNILTGSKIKYNVSNLVKEYSSSPDYSILINRPDGTILKANLYLTNNKPLKKTPEYYEASIYIFYTDEFIDGGHLFVRVYGDAVNSQISTDEYWHASLNPKCNDEKNIIKFYLPKNKKMNFNAFTETKFWKGEITTAANCQLMKLN